MVSPCGPKVHRPIDLVTKGCEYGPKAKIGSPLGTWKVTPLMVVVVVAMLTRYPPLPGLPGMLPPTFSKSSVTGTIAAWASDGTTVARTSEIQRSDRIIMELPRTRKAARAYAGAGGRCHRRIRA